MERKWLKYLGIGLMTFVGAYLAFYVVVDWHLKNMFNPFHNMRKMDRMERQQSKLFDKAERNIMKADLLGIRAERPMMNIVDFIKTDDEYKIIVNLRPFNNDEKNIEVKVEGNSVTVTGAVDKERHGKQYITKFMQSFFLDEPINKNGITKEKKYDKYVVIIPFND